MRLLHILLYCAGIWMCPLSISGQTDSGSEDAKRIKLQVVKPVGLEKQDPVATILESRLIQAVTLNGTTAAHSRFILTTHIQELSSQITTSAPPQYTTELEIVCSIMDKSQKTVLQQTSFNIKGVARSKEKAIMNAITSIQARHPQLKTLITKGKEKIMASYQTECEQTDTIPDKQVEL